MATREEKEEFLQTYLRARRKEHDLRRRLDQIQIDCRVPGCKPIDGMPHARGRITDLSDSMVEIEKGLQMVIKEKQKADILRTIVMDSINKVEKESHRHILKQKYIHGLKNSQIAKNMGITPGRVRQIYVEAIQVFEIPSLSKPLFRKLVTEYSDLNLTS